MCIWLKKRHREESEMAKNIIDDVGILMELSADELNEALLDEKYNKANLRELVRRSISRVKTYKKAFDYQYSEREKVEEKLASLKSKIADF